MATSCKNVKTRKKRGVEKFVAEDAGVECPTATNGTTLLVAKKKFKKGGTYVSLTVQYFNAVRALWAIQYNTRGLGGNNRCHNMKRHATGSRASTASWTLYGCHSSSENRSHCNSACLVCELSLSDCIAKKRQNSTACRVQYGCLTQGRWPLAQVSYTMLLKAAQAASLPGLASL